MAERKKYANKHLGLEEDEQRRWERLREISRYKTVDLAIGGLFICEDAEGESGALQIPLETTENVLDAMGVK